jgi:hypothetical protein
MNLALSHSEIDEIRKLETPDAADLKTYRRYARGAHNKTQTADQRRAFAGRSLNATADNVLKLILSTAASRLDFTGWEAAPPRELIDAEGNAPAPAVEAAAGVQRYLEGLYVRNQIARKQYETTFAQLRDGNHAVSLRWKPGASEADPGRVTIHRERWWDGTSGIFVGTDDVDEPAWAVKDWSEFISGKLRKRRVVYYADRFERYIEDGKAWQPYPLPGDPLEVIRPGVLPWVRAGGKPLGLPVVHFPNGSDDDSPYGLSDLMGLIGLQDDLNSIQGDIAAAAAFTGYQIIWTAGGLLGADSSATDRKGRLIVGPGSILSFEAADAKAGAISAGDMGQLTKSHEYKRSTIAVDSSTPIHLISGDWPSGDALIRAEMPLIDKVVRLARVDGPQWVLVGHRGTEIENAFGGGGLNEDALLTAVFAPPERLDALTQAQVAAASINLYAALSLISDDILFRRAAEDSGLLSAEEIKAVLAERKARAEEMAQQLDSGGAGGEDDGSGDGEEPPTGSFG